MAKGRPRKFDKDVALETALKLFWQHGYEGVSIAKLAQEMGINIPSLYSAFGNKENLFYQSVALYGQTNGNFYHNALAQPTAYLAARAILLAEVDLVTNPNAPDGCLMVQGALVTSPENQKLVDFMARLRATAEQWIVDRFLQAINDGDLPLNCDAYALASFIMTVNSGIAVQAKTGLRREELLKMVDLALLAIPSNF